MKDLELFHCGVDHPAAGRNSKQRGWKRRACLKSALGTCAGGRERERCEDGKEGDAESP
jgi:hypothetical protein